jgi:antitoxin MazE
MDVDSNKVILKALAEIRREQVLATKANPQTADLYDNAFVHAIMHRIYPIDHEDPGFKDTLVDILNSFPFYETYGVGRDQVKEIAELLDEKWRNEEKITFYDLEQPYRYGHRDWHGKDPRWDLINICRYFYLNRWFDERFWNEFMSSCPSEAHDITNEWDRSEIVDWI